MKTLRLIKNYCLISTKKERAFRFEFFMAFIQLLFQLSFSLIFWLTLSMYLPVLDGWELKDMLFYTAVVQLGDGLSGFFFGFRDLPENITAGELDKYLTRPVNLLVCLLFENVSLFYFMQQIISSLVMALAFALIFEVAILWSQMLIAMLIFLLGLLALQMLRGSIASLSFWFERTGTIQSLFDQLLETKQYPANLYPKAIRNSFLRMIPVYYLAYYPTALLLGKETFSPTELLLLFAVFLISMGIFYLIWKKGVHHYEANGG